MSRTTCFLLLVFVYAGLVGLSAWLKSWGGIALLVVGGVGWAWYRVQVARTAAAEKFFGDAGEDTRMTGLQTAMPSEMPMDQAVRPSGPRGEA